jgi:hypothetical protein
MPGVRGTLAAALIATNRIGRAMVRSAPASPQPPRRSTAPLRVPFDWMGGGGGARGSSAHEWMSARARIEQVVE